MPGTTNFPTSLDSHTGGDPFGFAEVANNKATTLNGAISSGDTTITVASTTGFASRGIIVCGTEVITYTGVSGGVQFTGCTRGAGGTAAAAHVSGSTVANVPVAANLNDLAAAIVANETKMGTGSSTPATDTKLEATGTGTSAWTKAASARAYHSAAQSIANNTSTVLALDSERFDNDTIHDLVTNNSRLTCKTAGKYLIVGNVRWGANTTGTRVCDIRLNGATVIASNFAAPTPSSVCSHVVSTIYQLAVNDYVELVATQFSGGALNVDAAGNYSPEFMMMRVAA